MGAAAAAIRTSKTVALLRRPPVWPWALDMDSDRNEHLFMHYRPYNSGLRYWTRIGEGVMAESATAIVVGGAASSLSAGTYYSPAGSTISGGAGDSASNYLLMGADTQLPGTYTEMSYFSKFFLRTTITTSRRYFTAGSYQGGGNGYQWGYPYFGSTGLPFAFPANGSTWGAPATEYGMTKGDSQAGGFRWKSADANSGQYIHGRKVLGGSLTDSDSVIYNFRIGVGWNIASTCPGVNYFEARLFDKQVSEDVAVRESMWEFWREPYHELGRRTHFLPATAGGDVLLAGTSSATSSESGVGNLDLALVGSDSATSSESGVGNLDLALVGSDSATSSESADLIIEAYAGPLWYVDASAGAGGDGSVGNPFDTLADATAVASDGDTIYVAAGTYTEELIVTNLDIDIVGDGAATTIIDAEDTRDSAATLSSMGGTISGITFTRGAKYGLLISNQSGNFDAYSTTVSNCVASSCRTASTTVGYGVGFQVNNANNVQSTITYEDCTAHSNGRMGFDTQEVQGTITRTRCTAYSNGDLGPGGGFYTHGWRASATSGWTGTAAPVYSRAKLSGLDGFGGMYNETDSEFLKIAATPTTTPAEGECSAVGSTMYVRLPGDANPAGKTIKWSRSDLTVVDTDLTAYSNGGYDDEHGSGIQYDDFTQNVTARRLTLYNNTGRGLRSFLANDLDIASVYAYNNATNSGTGNQKANITLDGWDVTLGNATSTGADVAYSSGQGAQTFRNLVSDNCATVLRADNGATMGATLTVDYYVYNGQTTVESENNSATITATNGTASDPALTTGGELTEGSPAEDAGIVWWSGTLNDLNGVAFDNATPNIGAFAGTAPTVLMAGTDGAASSESGFKNLDMSLVVGALAASGQAGVLSGVTIPEGTGGYKMWLKRRRRP